MNRRLPRNGFAAAALAAFLAAGLNAQTPSAFEIVKKAFAREKVNEAETSQYTFHRREEQRSLDREGGIKSAESKTFDVVFLFGEEYGRLIAVNDRPLSPAKDAEEQRRFERHIAKIKQQTPAQRRKRAEKIEREREEERAWVAEMEELFEFTLVGEDTVNGMETWIIRAEPRPDYQPKQQRSKFLKKTRGKFWIAKSDFGWMRLEAETLDTVYFGGFLFRLTKGSTFSLWRRKLEEGVWMKDKFRVRIDGRIGFLLRLRRETLGSYDNYRKFSAESKLITAEAPEAVTEAR